jgi:CheY-like chemotaxis protein
MPEILIIDDQESIVNGLKQMLAGRGYQVKTAISAENALSLIENNEFDCIISDLKLPGMSGIDMAQKLLKDRYHTKIILISAFFKPEDIIEAMHLGVSDVFPKPFKNQDILKRLEELLTKATHNKKKLLKKSGYKFLRTYFENFHVANYYKPGVSGFRLIHFKLGTNERIVISSPASNEHFEYIYGIMQGLNILKIKFEDMRSVVDQAIFENESLKSGLAVMDLNITTGSAEYALFGDMAFTLINDISLKEEKESLVIVSPFGKILPGREWLILFHKKSDLPQDSCQNNFSIRPAFDLKRGWSNISENIVTRLGLGWLNLSKPYIMLYGGFMKDKIMCFDYETKYPFSDMNNLSLFFINTFEGSGIGQQIISRNLSFVFEVLCSLHKKKYEKYVLFHVIITRGEKITIEITGDGVGETGMSDYKNASDDTLDFLENPGIGLINELRKSFISFSDDRILYEVGLSET